MPKCEVLSPCKRHKKENIKGEMLEWLKRHAWKACIRQKRIRGSNPRLSARKKGEENQGGSLSRSACAARIPVSPQGRKGKRTKGVRYREALAQQESPSLRKEERGREPRGFVIAKRLRSKNPRLSARKKRGIRNNNNRFQSSNA